nr:unnamed protein product [Digitaria exilis]
MKKTKASASKIAVDEVITAARISVSLLFHSCPDEAEPKKIRSSRSNRRRGHRNSSSSSYGSESPPRKRSKKHSRKIADKKSKRSKVRSSSRRRHRRSLSPSRSLSCNSSSSPSSCSSSGASERSVSPPPRSRFRDVRKKKGRGRDRERDRRRRKARRSASSSGSSASSGSSRSRGRSKGKSRKRRTFDSAKDGAAKDKMEIDYDNRHASWSEKHMSEDDDRHESKLDIAKKGEHDGDSYKKNLELESPPSMNANETQEMAPTGGGDSDGEDLELILRQKALENFRKFRTAAVMAGKTGTNGVTGNEALVDGPQNTVTKIAEAKSSAVTVTHLQRQGSSLVMKSLGGSPRSEDCGNGAGRFWKQEDSDTGRPTQQKGRTVEATHLNCQFRSPQDGRNSRSVMQRLVNTPGSCASVNQRLGSRAGVSHVNGAPTPRIRSVVSIPAREGLDASTYTTSPRPSENSAPVESSSHVGCPLIDISKAERTNGDERKTIEASASNGSMLSPAEGKSLVRTEDTSENPAPVESSSHVGCPLIDINKAERTNGDERKTIEASASNGSMLSPAEGKSLGRTDDKDSDQFQKKTFSRMHDGEAVEVSYKVYIPKKTPALARRKLQR